MRKQIIIAWAAGTAVIASVMSFQLLRADQPADQSLAKPPAGWADRAVVFNRGMLETRQGQCLSGTFVDYTEHTNGAPGPVAAVRGFGGLVDLRVQPFAPDGAVVEEFRGPVKIAAYEVLRHTAGRWVVVRRDGWAPCGPPETVAVR